MGMIAAEALEFVKHFDEHTQDQVTPICVAVFGFCVDIEQNHICVVCHGSLDVAKKHGVFDFALKKLNRLFTLIAVFMDTVTQKV